MSQTTSPQATTARPLGWPGDIKPVRVGRFSGRIEVRAVIVTVVALVLAIIAGLYALTVGSANLGMSDVFAALGGDTDSGSSKIILEWRMPRVVFSLLGGAALAVGGAVFQSITRNPLGSPDIIGFSTGAYTGALIAGMVAAGSALGESIGALAGGILTGLAVYLLAFRKGVSGMRIIVVGIGVSLFLGAFNTWMLTTMQLEQAISAASWGAGSLNEIGWADTVPLAIGVAICLPVALAFANDMRMLEMGDDAGKGVGVQAELVRVVMLFTGIILVSLVTASAGPIAFVALAAPQIAMRLAKTAGVRILPSCAMGALLLTAGDLVARTVIAPEQLPVGVVTLCVGGAYLVWLLAASGRKKHA